MLRSAVPSDRPSLIALAAATGLFQDDEAESLLGGVLNDLFAGRLGADHIAHIAADTSTGSPTGWVYFSRNATANQVWDLWWIGVAPARQGEGVGKELLQFVESHVRSAGGRLLIIETSSLPALDPTRRFYSRRGYTECGRVPDYYEDGDNKVIYVKRIAVQPTASPPSGLPAPPQGKKGG